MSSITFAYHQTQQGQQPLTLHVPERRQHSFVIGGSGVGKSSFVKNLAIQDMRAGRSLAFIDAHGDTSDELITYVPRWRTNDVVLIRVHEDRDHPVGINFLDTAHDVDKYLLASSVTSIFRHLFSGSIGDRADWILYNSIKALLDYPDSTIIDILRLLTNERFRDKVIGHIEDPITRNVWTDMFSQYSKRDWVQVTSPVLNKVGPLASGPLKNIVGQCHSTIDFQSILERRSILLVSLQKGLIGESGARVLGSFIIYKLYLTALQRQSIPEHERRDFYLYIDEAATYFGSAGSTLSSNDMLQTILPEARKYRLNVHIVANFVEQFSAATTSSILGNCGNLFIFRVGAADAKRLEPEVTPYIKPEVLAGQKNYQLVYKRPRDGAIPRITPMMPPIQLAGKEADREIVINESRKRYGRNREEVERKINRAFNEKRPLKNKRPLSRRSLLQKLPKLIGR